MSLSLHRGGPTCPVSGIWPVCQQDPCVPTQPPLSANPTIQSDLIQESAESKSLCLAPGASGIKEQGYSVEHELRFLKEAQSSQSMTQNRPFLQYVATEIRWISGHHL